MRVKKPGIAGSVKLKVSFGTVIEYDTNSKVVWSWLSSDYFMQRELKRKKNITAILDSHENAFFFDEQKKNVYVSFKNYNEVLKINYADRQVSNAYGKTGDKDTSCPLFSHQHSCKISKKGFLYLFNNNMCNPGTTPSALVLEETAGGALKVIWEYAHPYEGDFTRQRLLEGASGGNVIELPGDDMFVSMCNPYSNVFIVSHNKEILWDAQLEKFNVLEKKWDKLLSYRYSIILNRKELEHLVWGENIE